MNMQRASSDTHHSARSPTDDMAPPAASGRRVPDPAFDGIAARPDGGVAIAGAGRTVRGPLRAMDRILTHVSNVLLCA